MITLKRKDQSCIKLIKFFIQIWHKCFIFSYCYTYCVEVWGKTYKTITNPVYLLQDRAIKLFNSADCWEPTNNLNFTWTLMISKYHCQWLSYIMIYSHNVWSCFKKDKVCTYRVETVCCQRWRAELTTSRGVFQFKVLVCGTLWVKNVVHSKCFFFFVKNWRIGSPQAALWEDRLKEAFFKSMWGWACWEVMDNV